MENPNGITHKAMEGTVLTILVSTRSSFVVFNLKSVESLFNTSVFITNTISNNIYLIM